MLPGKTLSVLKLIVATTLCVIVVRETILHINTAEISDLSLSKVRSAQSLICIVSAFILMFFNWGIEIYKWQMLVNTVVATKFRLALRAVMSGVAVSLLMPNRSGEFAGRVLFLPSEKRIEATILTFYGNLIQLLFTLLFGIISYFVLQHYHKFSLPFFDVLSLQTNLPVLIIILLGLIILSLAFRENFSVLIHSAFSKLRSIKISASLHLKVFLLSGLRYVVFTMQFVLLMLAFGVNGNIISLVCGASFILLTTTILPTISVLEIPLRGGISFLVMNSFCTYASGASIASLVLWFLNLALPAITGAVILMFFNFSKWK